MFIHCASACMSLTPLSSAGIVISLDLRSCPRSKSCTVFQKVVRPDSNLRWSLLESSSAAVATISSALAKSPTSVNALTTSVMALQLGRLPRLLVCPRAAIILPTSPHFAKPSIRRSKKNASSTTLRSCLARLQSESIAGRSGGLTLKWCVRKFVYTCDDKGMPSASM